MVTTPTPLDQPPPRYSIALTVHQCVKILWNDHQSSLCCTAYPVLPHIPHAKQCPLPLSLHSHPSTAVPFPLITVSPFLDSVRLQLFCSFSFSFVVSVPRWVKSFIYICVCVYMYIYIHTHTYTLMYMLARTINVCLDDAACHGWAVPTICEWTLQQPHCCLEIP